MIEETNLHTEYGFFRDLSQIRQALIEIKNQNQQQQNLTKFYEQQQQQQEQQQQQFLQQQQQELKQYEQMTKRARSVGQGSKRMYGGTTSPYQAQFDQQNQENERQGQYQVKKQNFFQENPQFYQQQNQNVDFDPSYSMILDQDNSLDYYNYQQYGFPSSGIYRSSLFQNQSPVPREKAYYNNNVFWQPQDAKMMSNTINANRQLNQTSIHAMNRTIPNGSTMYDSYQSVKLSNSFGQQVKQFQDVILDQNEDITQQNSQKNNNQIDPNISTNSMIINKSLSGNIKENNKTQNISKSQQEETSISIVDQKEKQDSSTQYEEQQQEQPKQEEPEQQQKPKQQVDQTMSVAEKLEIKFLKKTIDQFCDDNQVIYTNFTDCLKVIEALRGKIKEQESVISSSYDKLKIKYIKLEHTNKCQIEQNKNLEKLVNHWKSKFEKLKESVKKGIEDEILISEENEKIIQQLTTENTSLRELLKIQYDDQLIKKLESKLDEVESDFYNNHCQKNPQPSDVEIKFMASNNKGINKEFKKFVSVEKSFQPDNYFSLPKKNFPLEKQFMPGLIGKLSMGAQLEKESSSKSLNQAQIIQQDEKIDDKNLPEEIDDEDEQDCSPPFSGNKPNSSDKQNEEGNEKKAIVNSDKSKLQKNDKEKQNLVQNAQQPSNSTIMSQKDKLSFAESSNKLQNIMKQREMQAYLESQQQEKIKQQQHSILNDFKENDENFDEDDNEDDEPVVQNNKVSSVPSQKEDIKQQNQQEQQNDKSNKPESLIIDNENSVEEYSLEPKKQIDYSNKIKDLGSIMSQIPYQEENLQKKGENNFNRTINSAPDDFDEDDYDDEDYEAENMENYYGLSQPMPPQKEVLDFSDRAHAKLMLLKQSQQLSQQMQNPKFFKSNSNEDNNAPTSSIQNIPSKQNESTSSQILEVEQQALTPQQKQRQEFIKMMQMSNSTIQKNLQSNNLLQKKDKPQLQSDVQNEKQINDEKNINSNKSNNQDKKLNNNQESKTDNQISQDSSNKDQNYIQEDKFNIQYNDQDNEEDEDEDGDEHIFHKDEQYNDEDQKIEIDSHDIEESDPQNDDDDLSNDYDNLEALKKQAQFKNKNKRYVN